MNKLITTLPYSKVLLTGIVLGVGLYIGVKVARILVRKAIFHDDIFLNREERREIVVH
jgi:hypothetical protein